MTCKIVEFSSIDVKMRSDTGTTRIRVLHYYAISLGVAPHSCLDRSIGASKILLAVHRNQPSAVDFHARITPSAADTNHFFPLVNP